MHFLFPPKPEKGMNFAYNMLNNDLKYFNGGSYTHTHTQCSILIYYKIKEVITNHTPSITGEL